MDVFAVESVLEQPDDVVSYRVLGIEPLCPRQQLACVDGGLLDWKARISSHVWEQSEDHVPKGETQVHGLVGVLDVASNVGQEGVNRVGDVVCVSAWSLLQTHRIRRQLAPP